MHEQRLWRLELPLTLNTVRLPPTSQASTQAPASVLRLHSVLQCPISSAVPLPNHMRLPQQIWTAPSILAIPLPPPLPFPLPSPIVPGIPALNPSFCQPARALP